MAKLSKEELDLGLVDKLYQNVIETGRIVRRLFVTFFTLMLVLSALAFDPEIFSADTPRSQPTAKCDSLTTDFSLAETQDPAAKRNQAAVRSEPAITLFGVKIPARHHFEIQLPAPGRGLFNADHLSDLHGFLKK